MPSLKNFNVRHSDVEDVALMKSHIRPGAFDGRWEASTGEDGNATTVIISGTRVWHDGDLLAEVKLLGENTCVMIMLQEDVRGEISDDGEQIKWSDGDCWLREEAQCKESQPTTVQHDCTYNPPSAGEATNKMPQAIATPLHVSLNEERVEKSDGVAGNNAICALFAQDKKAFADALANGAPVSTEIKAAEIWHRLRWDVDHEEHQMTSVDLLVAALLLSWPQGVELCLGYGADVNGVYTGFLRLADGAVKEVQAVPLLRVALSARGPPQCLLCRIMLGGKVRAKTVHGLKRKARAEMEADTAYLIDNWSGPFLEDRT